MERVIWILLMVDTTSFVLQYLIPHDEEGRCFDVRLLRGDRVPTGYKACFVATQDKHTTLVVETEATLGGRMVALSQCYLQFLDTVISVNSAQRWDIRSSFKAVNLRLWLPECNLRRKVYVYSGKLEGYRPRIEIILGT